MIHISKIILHSMRCYKDYTRTFSKLVTTYEGYKFYLPAFLDFRGRIYRCGVLHLHERDLARSLIQFSYSNNSPACGYVTTLATCYHYQSFISESKAVDWCE
ncbi:hypothetical protein Ccrd_023954 [Cynara cardunculus var. scolymus]|uniref:DNA-directed RNA polymerase n=1 Tax=Cynara cardunculus var. scolymus TaxID=59895 RepID=A0A103XD07_CYNCS|nr:hypothetical protein Ccrd_023954 [Cynara cardunculus var. scolymus]